MEISNKSLPTPTLGHFPDGKLYKSNICKKQDLESQLQLTDTEQVVFKLEEVLILEFISTKHDQ